MRRVVWLATFALFMVSGTAQNQRSLFAAPGPARYQRPPVANQQSWTSTSTTQSKRAVVNQPTWSAEASTQNKRPGINQPSWTWEEVVSGAHLNHKTVPHPPFDKNFTRDNYYGDNYNDLDQDQYQDYEYDEEQFRNDDYVYVDGDINEVENSEQFQLEDEHANRRVLDFLYHTFAQPVIQPDLPPQPSLIAEVFQTIDNHLNKDFTSLASLVAQGTATANPAPPQQAYGTPVATSIAAGPTADDFLVTDDLGNQHLVSVDDIVQSLSVLDERSLVDLILSPEGSVDPNLSIQLPPGNQINRAPELPATQTASAPLNSFQLPAPAPAPLPVSVTPASSPSGGVALPNSASLAGGGVPLPASPVRLPVVQDNVVDTNEIVILPAQLTKAIRNAAAAHGGEIIRPVRHTRPTNSENNEESFLITDEQGNVQIITMDDILSSLSNLDEESLATLLQDTAEASQTTINSIPSQSLNNIPGSASKSKNKIPASAPISKNNIPASVPISTTTTVPAAPLIETDFQGNVHIRPSESGSIKIDLNDHTAEHSKLKEPALPPVQTTTPSPPPPPPPAKNKTVISSDGTQVSTDQEGNIYITPDPDKPFTLDIQNIIALAEQAEQEQGNEVKASEFSGVIVNQLPEAKPTTPAPTPSPERGNQILAYLAGVENFLPNPILPGPLRPEEPQQPVQPPVPDFRNALLETLRLHTQPAQQPTPAPATPGIGARLSGLVSRLVNQAREVVGSQPVAPVVTEPQDQVIQLVVREQFEDGGEEIYGNINVPLPQGIHHSKELLEKLKQQENSGTTNGANRREFIVKDWKEQIPKSVVEAVLKAKYQEPQFNIANAIRGNESPSERANLITQQISKQHNKSAETNDQSIDPAVLQLISRATTTTSTGTERKDQNAQNNIRAEERGSHFKVSYGEPEPAPVYDAPAPVYDAPEPSYDYVEPAGKKGKRPLFDLYLLADFNKAKKLGYDSDHSFGAPIIGDPTYFVDTTDKHHY